MPAPSTATSTRPAPQTAPPGSTPPPRPPPPRQQTGAAHPRNAGAEHRHIDPPGRQHRRGNFLGAGGRHPQRRVRLVEAPHCELPSGLERNNTTCSRSRSTPVPLGWIWSWTATTITCERYRRQLLSRGSAWLGVVVQGQGLAAGEVDREPVGVAGVGGGCGELVDEP